MMRNMKDKDIKTNNDFIPEYFIWLDLESQRKRAIELQEMTKKREKRRKSKVNQYK